MLPERLKKFGLELSCEKSRLIEFGRGAFKKHKGSRKKLITFDFLGFTPLHDQKSKRRSETGTENYRQTDEKESDGSQ